MCRSSSFPVPSSIRPRSVVAHGILDSYRKEKGLPIPQPDAAAAATTSTLEQPAAAKRESTKSWVDKVRPSHSLLSMIAVAPMQQHNLPGS